MRARRLGWAAWLLAAAALYFFENNTGTRAVLIASILLPALSMACAFWSARRAVISLETPRKLRQGEKGACKVRAAGAYLFCSLEARLSLTNALADEAREATVALGGKTASIDVPTEHVGCVRVRVVQAAARDWFGLCRFSCETDAACAVIVEPTACVLPDALLEAGEAALEADETGAGHDDSEPDERVRDYLPGDPVRWIHWKLSAKTDGLRVRERMPSNGGGLLLMLETALGESAPRDMDIAVSALLALSDELARADIPHGVVWVDRARGALEWMEVDAVTGAERAREALLLASSARDGESVSRVFRGVHPDAHPARVVVFSPHALTDVSPLMPESAVTLALPEGVYFSQAASGARVVALPGGAA